MPIVKCVHGLVGTVRCRPFQAYQARIAFSSYSFDCNEPKHVHVRRERRVCKFWLEPAALSYNNGFSAKDLNRIRSMIVSNLNRILEAWDEHCGGE